MEIPRADRCKSEPAHYRRGRRVTDRIARAELPAGIPSPARDGTGRRETACVRTAYANGCESKSTSNQRWHHMEITISCAVAELSEAILSPAIRSCTGCEGTGRAAVTVDSGADCCEPESPRYTDGRGATWHVSNVKEETPREVDSD